MKRITERILYVFTSILLLLGLCLGDSIAQENKKLAETRGVYFWTHRNLSKKNEEVGRTQIKQVIETLVENNLNTIIYLVNLQAGSGYKSKVLPISFFSWDPLKPLIEEAHKKGIFVSAWFDLPALGNSMAKDKKCPILRAHPDWCEKAKKKKGTKVNREINLYIRNVVTEVVGKYDIDGVHYNHETGLYIDFVTLDREIKALKPHLVVSSYVFRRGKYNWEYDVKAGCLDWLDFDGYVYSLRKYKNRIKEQIRYTREDVTHGKDVSLTSAIGVGTLHGHLECYEVIDYIKAAREAGMNGVTFFTYGSVKKYLPELKKIVFQDKAEPYLPDIGSTNKIKGGSK